MMEFGIQWFHFGREMKAILKKNDYWVQGEDFFISYSLEKSIIHKLWEISNKKVYGSASKVIVIGERLKNNVSRYFSNGIEDSKIVVIHNWADTEKIKPI